LDPEKHKSDPEHGMPAIVAQTLRAQGLLRSLGPHAPDTVGRRIATWWRGLEGTFASPALKSAIRLAVRATPRPRKRKSAKAVHIITSDVLAKLLRTCSTNSLRDVRDRAILMVAFAAGGRRSSEIASLRREQLSVEAPILVEDGPPLSRHPSRSDQDVGCRSRRGCLPDGPAGWGPERLVASWAYRFWQHFSEDRSLGHRIIPRPRGFCGQCHRQTAGRDGWTGVGGLFCARVAIGLSDRGIPLPEAMEQSRYRSVQQATSYYNNATRRTGKAARLL
jgi:hypothetical protein